MVRAACGGNTDWLSYPVSAAPERTAWVPECRSVISLHSPIGPTPLALRSEGHVGLDLDPIGASSKDGRRDEVYRKSRADYRDCGVQNAVNLRAGKSRAVSVNEDIPTVGRSEAVKVYPIGVDRLHVPSLTTGHNEVVSEIGTEGREIIESRGQSRVSSSVVVLIV